MLQGGYVSTTQKVIGNGHGPEGFVPPGEPGWHKTPDQPSFVERHASLLNALLLFATVSVVLIPAVVLDQDTGLFLLGLAAAALLSFLPGWIYVQFTRSKGRGLYDEYVLNLFRLKIDEYRNLPMPPEHTSYFEEWRRHHDNLARGPGGLTKDNLYRRKFEVIYGRAAVSTFKVIHNRNRRFRDDTETVGPVLLATVVFVIGWLLVLQPDIWRGVTMPVIARAGRPDLLFEALQFGFFGAYTFILMDLSRRYHRDDLRADAYISAATRVVVTALLVSILHLVWPTEFRSEPAFAFLVGCFPQAGLQAIQAVISKPLAAFTPSLKTSHSLGDLEGLTVWYEARLAEEGIEDMQNLVSANLVDLLLRSRAPITRIIDWMDQAILRIHLPQSDNPVRGRRRRDPSPETSAEALRRVGIRTATDFERAWDALHTSPAFVVAVGRALGAPPDEERVTAQALLASLDGETNLFHVREFKQRQWLKAAKAQLEPMGS
jgi:hypothetical protein